ncbi:HD domain-containing protein [Micromonospora sp. DT228]|uniref:HD domain-containing protein n=1 Tax=Micromonospora sp. DT228 TaxID=3393443 RepID=UPI003CE6D2AC
MPFKSKAEDEAFKAAELNAFRGFSLDLTREKVDEALKHFGRLGIFSEYTKHDISHIDGMLEICDWLVPPATRDVMTPADWLLIVLATYFHDFGLLVTADEFNRRAETGFGDYVRSLEAAQDDSSRDYLAKLGALGDEAKERFHYQEFVRANHPTRIKTWLSGNPSAALGYDPKLVDALSQLLAPLHPSFVRDLGIVCESHHREDLNNVSKYDVRAPYGRTGGETANVQYAAILLRTTDLLHITEDRTPSVAALIINPSNPVSQEEWAKQEAVRNVRSKVATNREGALDESASRDTVEIYATFSDERGYFGLTRYLRYAEEELRRSFAWAVASRKQHGVRHDFPWRYIDTENIEAEGFIARQFEFEIDQHKILELLTGHTLYNDTKVVLRELVQNSIDAVRLQQLIEKDSGFEPTVRISYLHPHVEIEVMDNGTGMSQDIIEANFLKVGSSRYQDPDFRKQYPGFHPISRFGIGVLSAFMIADHVRVITSNPGDAEARELTLESVHGDYLIRLLNKESDDVPEHIRNHGTCVRLKIRPSAGLGDVEAILKHWLVVPRCKIEYVTDESTIRIGYDSPRAALEDSLVRGGRSIIAESSGKPAKWKVNVCVEDGFEIAYATSWDGWNQEWQLGETKSSQQLFDEDVDESEIDPSADMIGVCVEGIRVTNLSPGFQSESGVIAVLNATGSGSPKTNVARSNLERTPEYRSLLKKIYEAYAREVASELNELSQIRNFSLSRAAREVQYLLGPLDDRSPYARVESRTLLDQAISNVPCFLVEDGVGRQLQSLNDLKHLDEIGTVQGPITRHLGYFLEQVQTNVTIKAILDLVANAHVPMPELPIVGAHEDSLYLSQLLRKQWEVSSIETFVDPPFVVARWRRRAAPSRWIRAEDDTKVSAGAVQAIKEFAGAYRRTRSGFSFTVLVPTESVDFKVGHENIFAIEVGRDLLLTHDNPLLSIRSSEANISEFERLWMIGRIARHYYNRSNRAYLPEQVSSELTMKNRLTLACSRYLSPFLDEASMRAAVEAVQPNTLNVLVWDRRYTSSGSE